jgi:hypothetical protein
VLLRTRRLTGATAAALEWSRRRKDRYSPAPNEWDHKFERDRKGGQGSADGDGRRLPQSRASSIFSPHRQYFHPPIELQGSHGTSHEHGPASMRLDDHYRALTQVC